MHPFSLPVLLAAVAQPVGAPPEIRARPIAPEPSRPFDLPRIRIASPSEPWPLRAAKAPVRAPDWSDYRLYPPAALALDQEGRVDVETLIGGDGVPLACRPRRSSGYTELDLGTCDLTNLLRFAPAVDEEGRPVASVYRRAFMWMLSEPMAFAAAQVTADIFLTQGKVARCNLSSQGSVPSTWTKLPCSAFATDIDYYLGARRLGARHVKIAFEVIPTGSAAPAPKEGLPPPEAEWRSEFSLAPNGDVRDCRKLVDRGFGQPGANQQSPCGFFLTRTWFAPAPGTAAATTGIFALRVHILE